MSVQPTARFQYNHPVWCHYFFSSFGFDVYQAKFVSSIPKRPVQIVVGKWFIDARVFKWQILINKLTQEQLQKLLACRRPNENHTSCPFRHSSFGL